MVQALGDFCCTPHVYFEQQMKVGRGRSTSAVHLFFLYPSAAFHLQAFLRCALTMRLYVNLLVLFTVFILILCWFPLNGRFTKYLRLAFLLNFYWRVLVCNVLFINTFIQIEQESIRSNSSSNWIWWNEQYCWINMRSVSAVCIAKL